MRNPNEIIVNGKPLSEVLSGHAAWWREPPGQETHEKANLMRANLMRANLMGADLREAYLRGADLMGADLMGADLREADMWGADLMGADLREADMWGANLMGADLREADLRGADLRGADLREANLMGANLREANLMGANLREAKNIPECAYSETSILPEGALIGWKKLQNGLIAKIRIPEEAKRSNATGRKCRAEYAVVLAIYSDTEEVQEGISQNDKDFIYRVGETVTPDRWDDDRWNECSNGIHFFITRWEAENY